MAKYLNLPSLSIEVPDDMSYEEAIAKARKQYPEAFEPAAKPESGFVAASKSGLSGLKADIATLAGRTGIIDPEAAEKYIEEQKRYQRRTFKPTETWGEAPVRKGLELLGGSLPYMAAPVVAGGAAVLGGAPAAVGIGAAGLTSAAQFTGSNLSRQIEEGKKLQETELGSAAAAAVPQAALDMLSFKMMPAIRGIFSTAGKEITKEGAEAIAKQSLSKAAADYAKATGKAMGAEGLTEAAQQVLERMQAGLNLTNQQARDEYLESLIGGVVLGGALAPAGRYIERRGEAARQERDALAKAQEEAAAAAAEEERRKADPAYITQFVKDYEAKEQAFLQARKDLKKPGKDATPSDWEIYKEQRKALDEQRKELTEQSAEYRRLKTAAGPLLAEQAFKELKEQKGTQQELFETDEDTAGIAGPSGAVVAPTEPIDFEYQTKALTNQLADLKQQSANTTDLNEKIQIAKQAKQIAEALKKAKENAPINKEAALRKQMLAAEQKNDLQEQSRIANELLKLGVTDLNNDSFGFKLRSLTPPVSEEVWNQQQATKEAETQRLLEKLQAKETAARAKIAAKNYQPGALDIEAQEKALEEERLLQEEQERTEIARKRRVDPEVVALQRIGEKEKQTQKEAEALGGSGLTAVKVNPNITPQKNARSVRERIERLLSTADQADQEYLLAVAAKQKDAAQNARTRGDEALKELALLSKEGGAYAKTVIAARQEQQKAKAELEEITQALQKGQFLEGEAKWKPESTMATKETLTAKAAQTRANLIQAALKEAAAHRRAAGLPPITHDEAIKASSTMYDAVNDWVERSGTIPQPAKFEDVTIPAQMRADKIVKPATTVRKEVSPRVQGISRAEDNHFKARIQAAIQSLLTPAKGEVRRAQRPEAPLQMQFAGMEADKIAEARGETATTLGGELRRRTEFVRNKMAKLGAMRPAARDALNAAADIMDADPAKIKEQMESAGIDAERITKALANINKPTRQLLDAVEPVVDALNAGQQVKQVDIQAINDAIAAMQPTALEQQAAGQKALFPEIKEDLGYIRMTPKAFANSPKIKAVWDKLIAAREATEKQAAKQAVFKHRFKTARGILEKLRKEVENLEGDTKFFWLNVPRWSDKELVDQYVKIPDIGNTPEENALVDKYLRVRTSEQRSAFSKQELALVNTLLRKEYPKKQEEYQKRQKEAYTLLAQKERLDDLDNQLLQAMQTTNEATKTETVKLRDKLAVLNLAIKQTQSAIKRSYKDPLAKKILALENQAKQARGKYDERVELLFKAAYKRMDDALAEILDPEISKANAGLAQAKKQLAKEKETLERTEKRVQEILAQPEGKDRMQLATYQQFRYEEKLSIIEDLEKQIAAQEEDLANLMETRFETHDTQAAVLEAVSDKKVQAAKDRVVELEERLAALRGEKVTKTVSGTAATLPTMRYPFAAQKYEAELKAAQANHVAAKKQNQEIKAQKKTDAQKLETVWKEFFGGSGKKRVKNVVEPIKTPQALQLEKLREAEMAKLDRAASASLKAELKQGELAPIREEIGSLIDELGAYEEFPNDVGELKKLAQDETLSQEERSAALAKIAVIQRIDVLDAQLDAIEEGRPAKKQAPATVPSTAALARTKPLRTGTGINEAEKQAKLEEAQEKKIKKESEKLIKKALKRAGKKVNAKKPTRSSVIESYEFDETFDSADLGTLIDTSGIADELPLITNKTAQAERKKAIKAERKVPVRTANEYKVERLVKAFGTNVDASSPLHGMTFKEAAEYGAKTSGTYSTAEKALFERLIEVFETLPVDAIEGRVYVTDKPIQSHFGSAHGLFAAKRNVVLIENTEGLAKINRVLLHELAHAASKYALKTDAKLNEQVEALRQKVTDWIYNTEEGRKYMADNYEPVTVEGVESWPLDIIYGTFNADEFLAEAYSNQKFQDLLSEIPSDKPRMSIFTRLVQFLTKALGLSEKAMRSTFAESISLTERVFDKTRNEINNAERVYVDGLDDSPLLTGSPKYASPVLSAAGEVAKRVIAPQRGAMDAIKGEGVGLKFQTQFVDRFAPLETLSKYMDKLKGLQMMYYLRMFDQRMNFVAQSVGNGALRRVEKIRADGRKEYVIESQGGANLKNVVNTVKEANALVGSAEGNSNLFSMYLIAKRAERVGLNKLNYGGKITEADLQKVRDAVRNTPGLESIYKRAQTEYNQYNRDMLQFAVDSGAMSAGERDALISAGDYVPYYRERNGAFEMMLGDRPIARIGNTKEQPYLKELVGGEEPIIDFMTSAVQNTNMLTDMALRNIATKSAVFELQALGMAKIGKGHGASGPDVVKFREHGEEKHAFITSENVVIGGKKIPTGVPADLLVKGMEGVPFQTTLITKLMGGPARTLRKMVVLNPLYAARQLFRDSLAAPITSGADFLPVFGALRQVGSATGKTLEQRGITGGQVFSGSQEDLSMILRDIASNKSSWAQGINKLEHLSKAADASTRRAQYNSYIKQGMSEMEATYLSLESMNFSKRGVNPAVHALMHSIPFFNAQVQALNVLYKAFTGKMSFNEKLQIREKLFQRGMMVATFTMVYAALMQDDETYRNATPEQKYGNWFIPIPGMDEPLRLPIPFEIGYIFKAIPEAIVNTMMNKRGGEEAAKAFKHIAVQIIPGGSNMVKFGDVPIPLPVPQALKPVLEVGLNKSFYTGRELESAHEQSLEPGYRSRDKTSALARVIGENLNISPIKIDALISGYFSTTGLLLADALSFAMPSPDIAEPTKRLSDMRVIGGLFQPKDAGGIINATYERLKEAEKVKNTYNELIKSGKVEEAQTYLQANMQQYIEASVENKFSSYMQKVSQAEKAIRASSSLSPDEKRERLDDMRQLKIRVAEIYRNAADNIAESRQ